MFTRRRWMELLAAVHNFKGATMVSNMCRNQTDEGQDSGATIIKILSKAPWQRDNNLLRCSADHDAGSVRLTVCRIRLPRQFETLQLPCCSPAKVQGWNCELGGSMDLQRSFLSGCSCVSLAVPLSPPTVPCAVPANLKPPSGCLSDT